jgi:hypothetical protein
MGDDELLLQHQIRKKPHVELNAIGVLDVNVLLPRLEAQQLESDRPLTWSDGFQ